MSKHTKGPWVATKFNPVTGEVDDCYLYVEPRIAVIERKVKGHDQHDMANAHLIAAAPEQHVALIATQSLLERLGVESSDEYQANAAAIAKAKG